MNEPESDSIRLAMDEAWREHQHARDQTWKSVFLVALLVVGLITVDSQFHSAIVTTAAGAFVLLSAFSGVVVVLHHRQYERQKFTHIMNCQKALNLLRDDLIPESSLMIPSALRWLDAFAPRIHNTPVFLLRILLSIMGFAVLIVVARWFV